RVPRDRTALGVQARVRQRTDVRDVSGQQRRAPSHYDEHPASASDPDAGPSMSRVPRGYAREGQSDGDVHVSRHLGTLRQTSAREFQGGRHAAEPERDRRSALPHDGAVRPLRQVVTLPPYRDAAGVRSRVAAPDARRAVRPRRRQLASVGPRRPAGIAPPRADRLPDQPRGDLPRRRVPERRELALAPLIDDRGALQAGYNASIFAIRSSVENGLQIISSAAARVSPRVTHTTL